MRRSLTKSWAASVQVHDPAATLPDQDRTDPFRLRFTRYATIEAAIDGAGVVVIATPHPEYLTYDFGNRVVIDPWMAMEKKAEVEDEENLLKLEEAVELACQAIYAEHRGYWPSESERARIASVLVALRRDTDD
jgi:UDP-N-acetyl-D-mannosaminuronate dehydrogenase